MLFDMKKLKSLSGIPQCVTQIYIFTGLRMIWIIWVL